MTDFTGKPLKDHYQKLLQISASGEIADATGSAIGISVPTNGNLSIDGDLTATGTGSFGRLETTIVSSSVLYSSGSNIFGDDDSDNHLFRGHITASGNISGSSIVLDNIYTGNGAQGGIQLNSSDTVFSQAIRPSADNSYTLGTPSYEWSQLNVNQITASGNISSSGTLYANEIELASHLYIDDSIVHAADTNTKIRFPEADAISFHTNGSERMRIDASGNITASGTIEVGSNEKLYLNKGDDTYVQAMADDIARVVAGGNQMLLLDYDTGNRAVFGNGTKVYIGNNNNNQPSSELEVTGDISASGYLNINQITASGNISASGDFYGEDYFIEGKQVLDYVGGTDKIRFGNVTQKSIIRGDTIQLGGTATQHVTASGNISGSITSTGSFGRVNVGYGTGFADTALVVANTGVTPTETPSGDANDVAIYHTSNGGISLLSSTNNGENNIMFGYDSSGKTTEGQIKYANNSTSADASMIFKVNSSNALKLDGDQNAYFYNNITASGDISASSLNLKEGYYITFGDETEGAWIRNYKEKFYFGTGSQASPSMNYKVKFDLTDEDAPFFQFGGNGGSNSGQALTVEGGISSSLGFVTQGNITASGNISGSEDSTLTIGSTAQISNVQINSNYIRGNNTGGSLNIGYGSGDGNETQIWGGGTAGPAEIIVEIDTISLNADITASGDISSSATSTGSLGSLKVDGASVDFSGLPTSDPGVAGRLWNDSNTVKISAG